MLSNICRAFLAFVATVLLLTPAAAEDRKYERDWRTGVALAPGAWTWTEENFEQKKIVISETAQAWSKTCTHYAFLGWKPEAGAEAALRAETRKNYEAAGFGVQEAPGGIPTDTVWLASKADMEAIILWGTVEGSAVYLSCLTKGEPAGDPDKGKFLAALFAACLGSIALGAFLFRRMRAQAKASLAWPSVPGVVKSSEVSSFRLKGSRQYKAKIAYDYVVNGVSYVGDRIRLGAYAGAKSVADKDAEKYAAGAPVEVRYDPAKPASSVLETGSGGVSIFGIVLMILGVLLLLIAGLVVFI